MDTDVGLAFRLAVGVGILGLPSLFACAATDPLPRGERHIPDLQWCHNSCDGDQSGWCGLCDQKYTGWRERPIQPELEAEENALPGAAEEIDPDCPYLTFKVLTALSGNDLGRDRAKEERQKPYMEMFSVQLERVGFKLWEPFWVQLRREGFGELATFLESTYLDTARMEYGGILVGGIRELTAREIVELEKILATFTTREEERLEQIFNAPDSSTWLVRSSVLDIAGSEEIGLPEGARVLVWHWTMEKQPTVLDGALRMDLFSDPTDYDPNRKFGSIGGHTLVIKSDSEAEAARYAEFAATTFLPHVRQLCADMSATLLEEEKELERIRDQLNEEIVRVRERRAEQEKRLKLEVEQ